MATRYTDLWDETEPDRDTVAGYMGDHMMELKTAFRERMQAPPWPVAYMLKEHGAVAAGTLTIDYEDGDVQTFTLPTSGTVTIAFSHIPSNSYDEKCVPQLTLIVTNPSSGTPTLAWPASVEWPYNTAPLVDATASKSTVYQLLTVDAGTKYYATMSGTKYD